MCVESEKRSRLENRLDELQNKLRKIRAAPDFEEYNRADHVPDPKEPALQPKKSAEKPDVRTLEIP